MLIACTDPCCVLTKGTLMQHCFSTNVRMQLNLEHLPNSFGFLSSAAVRCEYMVPVIPDQLNEASELRAFMGHYWRFLKDMWTPSSWKEHIWGRHRNGSGGTQELNPFCGNQPTLKWAVTLLELQHMALTRVMAEPHTVPHVVTVIAHDGCTTDQLEATGMLRSCINIWGKAVSEMKWRDRGRIWPLKD